MYMPVIEEERCGKCRRCANICPKKVLECRQDEVCILNPIYCTGCESCVAVCTDEAIKVKEF